MTLTNNSSFLNKLSTLRDFVTGMGMKVSESDLSQTLRQSGYNVEMALERILTGSSAEASGASFETSSGSSTTLSSSADVGSNNSRLTSTPAPFQKRSLSLKKAAPNNTSCNKRSRLSSSMSSSSIKYPSQSNSNNNNRLLLCKRWTVACSKSIRGRVNHGELLDFTQNNNWKNHSTTSSSSSTTTTMDPIVRFRSVSGNVEGSLNSYLCGILSPLLRLRCCDTTSETSTIITPLIHLEGEALMEDRHIIIGSDVPLSLKIYLNDPIQFFDLFTTAATTTTTSGGQSCETDSNLFFSDGIGSGGGGKKMRGGSTTTPRKKNKMKTKYSREELADAAFRLLQWAEMGEEVPLLDCCGGKKDGGSGDGAAFEEDNNNGGEAEDTAAAVVKKDQRDNDDIDGDSSVSSNGDGDFEQNSMEEDNEELNELNQLVATTTTTAVSAAGKNIKVSTKPLPELSDPIGFKSGVELRPYQRQALHWMCRREGYICEETDTDNGRSETTVGDLDLLAELAGSASSRRNSDPSIVVYGSKPISCDCGPVVVSDDSVASNSIPVADFGQTNPSRGKYIHHPLWRRRFLATDDLTAVFSFYVNELLGIASCVPPNPPKQCVGGILADSMGLGKTVMLLSLILTTKESEDGVPDDNRTNETLAGRDNVDVIDITSDNDEPTVKKMPILKPPGKVTRAATTLIIVPLSLVSQWEEELATKTTLSHLVFYEVAKKSSAVAFSSVDVVVTTYGTVQSEFKSMMRSGKSDGGLPKPGQNQPLLMFGWKRVILDEAHGIKNPSTIVSRACCMLKAQSRWAVTGTPLQNSLQDVYGLLKFLRHEPWCEASFWRKAITSAASAEVEGGANATGEANQTGVETSPKTLAATVAFGRVRRVLAPIILRRTKDTLMEDGTPILTLPPIDFSVVNVILSHPEREFYNALLERSQSVFEGFLKSGTASKSWFAIFSLLTRLRQACDHVSLTVHQSRESEIISSDFVADDEVKVSSSTNNDDNGESTVNDKFLEDLLAKFKHSTNEHSMEIAETVSKCIQSHDKLLKTECPICFEEPNVVDSVHTPCAHMFCKDCLMDEFQEQKNRSNKNHPLTQIKLSNKPTQNYVEGGLCPVCNEYVQVSTLIQIKETEDGEMTSKFFQQSPDKKKSKAVVVVVEEKDMARETLELALYDGASSAKLDAILKELDEVWRKDPGCKVLVYSQYLRFLDIIGEALRARSVACYRIDGKMSLNERISMIQSFNKSSNTTTAAAARSSNSNDTSTQKIQRGSVCLGSMKAAGVGLNLVSASSVFIVDPWWNAAVEDQCVNRIHRIGQKANVVRVRKFVVIDSVEEKIVKLQTKKKGMANEILSETKGDDDGRQVVATMKPTLEDFKLIFGR